MSNVAPPVTVYSVPAAPIGHARRQNGGVEKQFRLNLGPLPVAYKCDLDSPVVYIMDGAVTTFSNQNARRAVSWGRRRDLGRLRDTAHRYRAAPALWRSRLFRLAGPSLSYCRSIQQVGLSVWHRAEGHPALTRKQCRGSEQGS